MLTIADVQGRTGACTTARGHQCWEARKRDDLAAHAAQEDPLARGEMRQRGGFPRGVLRVLTTLLRGAQRGFRTPRDGDLVLPRTSSAVKPARARSSAPSRQSEKGVQSKRWSVRGTATVELFASVLNAAVCSAAGAGVDWQRRRQQIYQPLFDCDQVPTGPHGCSRASDLRQLNSKLRTPYPAPGC
jgi:hypothetical protein